MEKNLYVLNENGVAEYVIAKSKNEAVSYIGYIWGIDTLFECYHEYLEDNPEDTIWDFIDYFANELEEDREFKLEGCGKSGRDTVTKTVREWLEDVETVPCYFACENY